MTSKPVKDRFVPHVNLMSQTQLHDWKILNIITDVGVLERHIEASSQDVRPYLCKAIMMVLAKPNKRNLMEQVWRGYDRTGPMWKTDCPHWMRKTWEFIRGWAKCEWYVTSPEQDGEFDDDDTVLPAKRVKIEGVKMEVMNVDEDVSEATQSPPARREPVDPLAETQLTGEQV